MGDMLNVMSEYLDGCANLSRTEKIAVARFVDWVNEKSVMPEILYFAAYTLQRSAVADEANGPAVAIIGGVETTDPRIVAIIRAAQHPLQSDSATPPACECDGKYWHEGCKLVYQKPPSA